MSPSRCCPKRSRRTPSALAGSSVKRKFLASLNHPHIAAIYGLEESDGYAHFLVLELVDGETLADRIARGPIPVDEALRDRTADC